MGFASEVGTAASPCPLAWARRSIITSQPRLTPSIKMKHHQRKGKEEGLNSMITSALFLKEARKKKKKKKKQYPAHREALPLWEMFTQAPHHMNSSLPYPGSLPGRPGPFLLLRYVLLASVLLSWGSDPLAGHPLSYFRSLPLTSALPKRVSVPKTFTIPWMLSP